MIWSSSGAFSMSVMAPALYAACTPVTAQEMTSRVAVPPEKPTAVRRAISASDSSLYCSFIGSSRLDSR